MKPATNTAMYGGKFYILIHCDVNLFSDVTMTVVAPTEEEGKKSFKALNFLP